MAQKQQVKNMTTSQKWYSRSVKPPPGTILATDGAGRLELLKCPEQLPEWARLWTVMKPFKFCSREFIELLHSPLSRLEPVSTRLRRILHTVLEIRDIAELVELTEADVLKTPGFGKTTLFELIGRLQSLGLRLGMSSEVELSGYQRKPVHERLSHISVHSMERHGVSPVTIRRIKKKGISTVGQLVDKTAKWLMTDTCGNWYFDKGANRLSQSMVDEISICLETHYGAVLKKS